MAQLMPLPLTVSCSSKIQIGFTFLVPAHLGSPGHRAVKRLYVCMYVVISKKFEERKAKSVRNEVQVRLIIVHDVNDCMHDWYL